jgi:hypothetical protein
MWMRTEDGGYVNLDHVVRIKPAHAEHGQAFVLRLVDGDSARIIVSARADLPNMLGTILPAQPGQEVLLVSYDTYISELPTENDVWFTRLPVLGWRDGDPEGFLFGPAPILPRDITINEFPVLVLADGCLLSLNDANPTEYQNIETMQAAFLERARDEWKAKRERGKVAVSR